jgi:hypothetical protein
MFADVPAFNNPPARLENQLWACFYLPTVHSSQQAALMDWLAKEDPLILARDPVERKHERENFPQET